ncbi:MAG TPA: hypothetical protein VGM73_01365 [Candidatus Didemnitutus sp.]|jgi:hypothetical protein
MSTLCRALVESFCRFRFCGKDELSSENGLEAAMNVAKILLASTEPERHAFVAVCTAEARPVPRQGSPPEDPVTSYIRRLPGELRLDESEKAERVAGGLDDLMLSDNYV